MESKICAAYIRVSTHDQEEYSPESQIKILRDYAKQHHMILPEEYIFRDDGISGRNANRRTAFQEMIATAKDDPRPFDVLLLWKFSRFARNQEESIVYKSMLRKKCGIEVISVTEPIMDGPFGSLIERIIEWQDEYYSINLGTEVRRGMTERAGRGLPVSTAPLGYTYQEKQLVIVPEEAETVRMIYRDFLAGVPMIAIAKKLNSLGIKTKRGGKWENRTVRYILTNPTYMGKIRWCPEGVNDYHKTEYLPGTLLVDGEHQPIISPEDYQAAEHLIQEYLKKYQGTASKAQRQQVSHMLQGLVKCSACGGTLTKTSGGLNCSKYVHGLCTNSHFIKMEKLEALVIAAIISQLGSLDFDLTPQERPALSGEQEHLKTHLKKEEEILRRHKEAYAAGIDSLEEYRSNKQATEQRILTLKESLGQLSITTLPDKRKFAKANLETVKLLQSPTLSPQEKNSLLRSFVDHIVFHKDTKSLDISYHL